MREKLEEFLGDKDILIVGGGPDAGNFSEEFYDGFEVVVRINNYKKIHSFHTDVFFSYFGRNIKKTQEELKQDGVEFLINKYPNEDMRECLDGSKVSDRDFRWVYDYRKPWWFKPLVAQKREDLLRQVKLLGGYMPTTGFACVDFFVNTLKRTPYVIGFDCFKQKIHNLDEPWDESGQHKPWLERKLLEDYHKGGLVQWIQKTSECGKV